MNLSAIVAVSENRVIGREGKLPWTLKADLTRFRQLTSGHHVIMGRTTYEGIGRPLPMRTNVVLSNSLELEHPGITVAHSIQEALEIVREDPEPFVIGGSKIYEQMLPYISRFYVTLVHAEVLGDAKWNELDMQKWSVQKEERHSADENNQYDYSYITYIRNNDQ